jgi:hypothetical protein
VTLRGGQRQLDATARCHNHQPRSIRMTLPMGYEPTRLRDDTMYRYAAADALAAAARERGDRPERASAGAAGVDLRRQ